MVLKSNIAQLNEEEVDEIFHIFNNFYPLGTNLKMDSVEILSSYKKRAVGAILDHYAKKIAGKEQKVKQIKEKLQV